MKILKLTLKVKSSLLIGGQTSPVLVDIATARDPAGIPLILASAIKGALRIEFERLARLKYPQDVCDGGTPEKLCGPESDHCIVCSVFGSPGLEGKLRFHDARLSEELWQIFSKQEIIEKKNTRKPSGTGYVTRPGVAISRKRKAASEHMLFASETVANFIPECNFEAEVALLKDLTEEEWNLLKLAVCNLEAVGADKSRGLGHLEVSMQEVYTKTNPLSDQNTIGDLMVTLIPEEYVRVSSAKVTENFMDSLEFIPGSAVRGAVARSFAESHGNNWKDNVIREAFLRSPALFSDFYPTLWRIPSRPIPLSARTCKLYPGLAVGTSGRESHGTKDILIAATVVKKLSEFGVPVVMDDRCKHCSSPLKGIYGFYLKQSPGEPKLDMSYRMNTKTAINRNRMTSAEGQLYSYELMDTMLESEEEDRIRFTGIVTGLTDDLRRYLENLNGRNLFVGGARYRGFGQLKVAVKQQDEDILGNSNEWQQRMESFTEVIKTPLSAAGISGIEDRMYFSLTLLSDLILAPVGWSAKLIEEVENALNIPDHCLELEKVITQTSYRGGYSDALGIRKDLFPVVRRGSAFVFSCKNIAQQYILGSLPELLRRGIGARREEGFGRVSFCDPFHIDRMEQ